MSLRFKLGLRANSVDMGSEPEVDGRQVENVVSYP
jgi:hypothetical protein